MQLYVSEQSTIAAIHEQLKTGQTTSVQLVEQCFAQIDELEPTIGAWVVLDKENALQQARKADEQLAAGQPVGPLHGIPLGIKDIIDVAGFPTRAGSPLLPETAVANDAPVVKKLREAGAVILGKTVTTQFAFFDPPKTVNPWNDQRTPGGSSSGSAAAVATGMCLAALGSQTGGSITRPASFCGIMGCKPTLGGVSTQGVFPISPLLDHVGPMARTVGDLALIMDVISESPATGESLFAAVSKISEVSETMSPRFGHLTGFYIEQADAEMTAAMDQVCEWLTAQSAQIDNTGIPHCFDELHHCHGVIMAVDAGTLHQKNLTEQPDQFAEGIRGYLMKGLEISDEEYKRCCDHQSATRTEALQLFEKADILICPASVGPAPDCSTTGDPAFNAPWSYTGYPTINMPIGLSSDGLPLGIQLVGRPGEEKQLFEVAQWCENVFKQRV